MNDKKRMAKGIKLNASQMPLKRTGDFVLGADSRKVLSDKILDNLNNRSNAGHFAASLGSDYKAWSVSREFERPPSSEAEADAHMRMIEGASPEGALQNDNYDPVFVAEPNRMLDDDPFFLRGDASMDSSATPDDPEWSDGSSAQAGDDPQEKWAAHQTNTLKLPAADAAQPRQTLERTASNEPAANEPSPWGAPVFETGSPSVIKQSDASAAPAAPNMAPPNHVAFDSPWAGPVMDAQPPADQSHIVCPPAAPAAADSDPNDGWTFIDDIPASDFGEDDLNMGLKPVRTAAQEPPSSVPALDQSVPPFEPPPTSVLDRVVPPHEPPLMPATTQEVVAQDPPSMASAETFPAQELSLKKTFQPSASSLESDSQLLPAWMSDLPSAGENVDSEYTAISFAEPQAADSTNKVESEIFLNSIPNEEFIIDNDTLRNLFKSLVEPKVSPANLKPASKKTAEQAIEAAAKILSSEVEIDLIPVEEIETAAVLELDAAAKTVTESGVREEAFSSHSSAAKDAGIAGGAHDAVTGAGAANVIRTARGTIELATHANGRQLIPQYNPIGMLVSVESSDGFRLLLADKKDVWAMMDASGRTIQSGISGVAFDKQGNLSYCTNSGDIIIWKTDGTIDTKFRGKASIIQASVDSEQETKTESSPNSSSGTSLESSTDTAQEGAPEPAQEHAEKPAKRADGKSKPKPASKAKPKKKKR